MIASVLLSSPTGTESSSRLFVALGGSCCSPAAPSRDAMDARKQLQGRRGAAGCVGGEISDGGSLKPGLVKKHREDDGGGGGGVVVV